MRREKDKTLRQYLTTADYAQAMKLTKGAVRELCQKGLIPSIRTPGGHYRIPSEVIDYPMRRHGGGGA